MTDKNPYESNNKNSGFEYTGKKGGNDKTIATTSIIASIFLVIWYLFLAAVGVALLGFAALFVVCMV